jgi:hypothetical protein
MLDRTANDNSPPLYYVVLQGWSALFGDSPVAMRSLSVICGVGAVVAVFALARALNLLASTAAVQSNLPLVCARPTLEETIVQASPKSMTDKGPAGAISPVVAAGLMATSPFQIAMSSEARPYALGVLLAVLSTWAFVRIEYGTGTWRTVLAYAVATTLLAYTHHFAWFVVAGQGFFALTYALSQVRWSLGKIWTIRPARQVAFGILAVGLAYSLWLPTFLRQTRQVADSFWIPPPTVLEVSSLVYRLFALPTITIQIDPVDALTAAILLMMGTACLFWRARAVDLLILSFVFTGLCLPLLFSASVVSIMNPRYFVLTHVFLLLGVAALIKRAPTVATQRILSYAAIGLSLFAYSAYCRQVNLGNPYDGFLGVAAHLDEQRNPSDPVIAGVAYAFFPVLAHARYKDNIRLYIRKPPKHFYGVAALSPALVCGDRALRPRSGSFERLWLIEMEDAIFELPSGWKRNSRATFNDDFVPDRELYVTECMAE